MGLPSHSHSVLRIFFIVQQYRALICKCRDAYGIENSEVNQTVSSWESERKGRANALSRLFWKYPTKTMGREQDAQKHRIGARRKDWEAQYGVVLTQDGYWSRWKRGGKLSQWEGPLWTKTLQNHNGAIQEVGQKGGRRCGQEGDQRYQLKSLSLSM